MAKRKADAAEIEATRHGCKSPAGQRVDLGREIDLAQAIEAGELRLRSRVDSLGRRLTVSQLAAIASSVSFARTELAKATA